MTSSRTNEFFRSNVGRVALVTGSTSGVGLGIAHELARSGADIMLNGFGGISEIEALRADLAATYGTRCGYNRADLSEPEQVRQLVDETVHELGGCHILVNNAGIQHTDLVEDFPLDMWNRIIAINLTAVFLAMKYAIPHMKRSNWGRIINIASAHGMVGSAAKGPYVATKHGVMGLTRCGALELANTGVTVNAICPGWVLTPLVQKQIDERAKAQGCSVAEAQLKLLQDKQPLHAFTTPQQIGAMAVFLCSDAAQTITGAPLSMDGGWTAH